VSLHTRFCRIPYQTSLDDPKAIYVDPPATNADSSAALQAAIDKASGTAREGIVLVPAGRYIITRTIYLWPGVRLIGYGATRPVFMLPPNTPGFQRGLGVMVMFTGLTPQERCRRTTTWPMPIRIPSIRR
jgi:Pectate lyase superfamily protein